MDEGIQQAVAGLLEKSVDRQLVYYLNACTRCLVCKDACHQYAATNDVTCLPAHRLEVVRRFYGKHLTRTGRFIGALRGSRAIDDKALAELYEVTYNCTGCRRCMYYCPFSIDTSWVLALSKSILVAAGKRPEIMDQITSASIFKGENIAALKNDMVEALKFSEEELRQRVGDPTAKIPVDVEGADILYVSLPGSYSILPAAVLFHQAQVSWTLSLYEPANFGYFMGDAQRASIIARRIVDEAKRLRVKEVIVSECGHGYRVMKWLCETWSKERNPFKVGCVLEAMASYVEEGRITLKRDHIGEPLTYHDPCQMARNGGIYEEPRYVLRRIAGDFREMSPNREKNWCCGGGGGLQAEPELDEFRVQSGLKKVEQIRRSGARIVVAPCDNCRLQLEDLNRKHGLDIRVCSVTELAADATVVSRPVSGV